MDFELLRIVQVDTHINTDPYTHCCRSTIIMFFKKQPMRAEHLKSNMALYLPMQRYISGYFPFRHIKSQTTTNLKILVLVYSKARALKLECFRSDVEYHKTNED